jgi:HEAT repeat protein
MIGLLPDDRRAAASLATIGSIRAVQPLREILSTASGRARLAAASAEWTKFDEEFNAKAIGKG